MSTKKIPMKEEKDGEKQKLKKRINKLEKENNRLKSELRTLEAAFERTTRYLKDNTDGFSVEKVIKGAMKDMTLRQIKEEKPKCEECESENIYEGSTGFGLLGFCKDCNHRWKKNKDGNKEEET